MPLSPLLGTIRSAIVTEVKEALNPLLPGNVTTVHSYRRFWRDALKFNSLFKRVSPDLLPGKINGWMIYRTATRVEEALERWRFYSIHRFTLEGYMGIQDADVTSDELAFENQIEVIRDNLRLNRSVFGNMEKTTADVEVESIEAGTVPLGDATCWRAILTLEAEAIEVKTE